jgi:thiol-disulfide isomerase/thioredoxin
MASSSPRQTKLPAAPVKKERGVLWLALGIGGGLLVAVFLVAFLLTGGDDDTASAGPVISYNPGAEIREFQGVSIEGEGLPSLVEGAPDPALGLVGPTLRGARFDGEPVVVAPGSEDGPVMLVFLAHWCPHCNAEVPEIVEWNNEGGVPEGLRIVAVTTSTNQNQPNYPPSEWLVENKWPFEAMADSPDSAAAMAYGVTGFPYSVIMDADGKVVLRLSGEVGKERLDQLVDDALGITATDATTAP